MKYLIRILRILFGGNGDEEKDDILRRVKRANQRWRNYNG